MFFFSLNGRLCFKGTVNPDYAVSLIKSLQRINMFKTSCHCRHVLKMSLS